MHDPALVQAVQVERALDQRLRHVADVDPAGRDALLAAAVGVAVEDEVGARVVDRLGEQVPAEERVDLEALAGQRRLDRREVEQRDADVRAYDRPARAAGALRPVACAR